MEECGPFDDDDETTSLVKSVGGGLEFVRTTLTDYIWETRIEDLVNVAEMNVASVNFKTLYPGEPYIRMDLELSRKKLGERWMKWQATKVRGCVKHGDMQLTDVTDRSRVLHA